ncbi:hypothetical protein MKW98_002675 [Papaver atlanticum]|uniref:HORMA domain-containing protein n=1 Tax=Papaver atlanticum TaxID=357466 RepID=A0AAD4SD84_9MAGN|nr:hypothetical protein MKW98_002675 [Papaver atlanticum]
MGKFLSQVIHIAFDYLGGSPQNQTDGNKLEMRDNEFEKREKELEASLDELKLQVKASKCKIEELTQKSEDKEEELESLEDLNQTLIVKERRSNDELQEARKELVNQLKATDEKPASYYVPALGVYDALQKKYLRTLLFCISEAIEGPMIEEYAYEDEKRTWIHMYR